MLKYALMYHGMGFSVIPLEHGSKKPLVPWKRYQMEKPSEEQVREWFSSNTCNIGIVTGAVSNLIVYDFDSPERLSEFPPESVVKTARGFHLYTTYREGIKSRVLQGVEIKSNGSYIVAPPSLHPEGVVYSWSADCIRIMPHEEVSRLLNELPASSGLSTLYKGVSEGTRNVSLARLVGSMLKDGVPYEDCLEFALIWNQSNKPPMQEYEVISVVKSIYRRSAENDRSVYVKLFSGLLRHGIFSISRQRIKGYTVTHRFDNFEVTVTAFETLNHKDNNIFKAVIKLLQRANYYQGITVQTIDASGRTYQVAGATFKLREIMSLAKADWNFVKESLNRLSTLRLSYRIINQEKKEKIVHITPFPRIVIDEMNNIVSVFFDWELFRKSLERNTALTQNLSLFVSLESNVSKALFDFLTVNSTRTEFKESTLIERLGLGHLKRRFARRMINRSLEELTGKQFVKSFKQTVRAGERYYCVER